MNVLKEDVYDTEEEEQRAENLMALDRELRSMEFSYDDFVQSVYAVGTILEDLGLISEAKSISYRQKDVEEQYQALMSEIDEIKDILNRDGEDDFWDDYDRDGDLDDFEDPEEGEHY